MAMSVGIIGFGSVGQSVYSCLNTNTCTTNIFDPLKQLVCIDDIKQSDVVFLCLPTPTNNDGQDFSYYKNFFDQQRNRDCVHKHDTLFVVKSTVLYDNIKPYMNNFKLVINPEFLNANTSYKDFYEQKHMVVGGRIDLCKQLIELYETGFKFETKIEYHICSAEMACHVKYIHNIYHAYKSLFWNYVNDVTGNHRKVFDLYSNITGNTFEMSRVAADGKLGYGGECFPKDVSAFAKNKTHILTKFMIEYNSKLRS